MTPTPEEASLFVKLAEWAWAPVAFVLALLVRGALSLITDRLHATEVKADAALSKTDFMQYVERVEREQAAAHARAEKQRDELRQAVLSLYGRTDELKDLILRAPPAGGTLSQRQRD